MSVKRINPESLYETTRYGFSHATIDEENGIVHLAGQVAWDKDYNIVGGQDLALQTRKTLENITSLLEICGSDIAHLLQIRVYIVNHDVEKLGIVCGELNAFYGELTPAPNTVIGVQALALPDFMIEIEATAKVKA